MSPTFEQQLQKFPGCEPAKQVTHRKVSSFYGDAQHMEMFKSGQLLDTLMMVNSIGGDFHVGEARIEITFYDKPVGKSVADLVAQRAKVLQQAHDDAMALTRQIQAAGGEYLPTEAELDDVLDMQRSEPRSEAWKRSGGEA